jgi:dTDP-4-amino-4,6-dideoxygalactose transaminase
MTWWRERYALTDAPFPVATACGASCVSLPLFPSMRADEVERVIAAVRGAFR